MRGSVRSLLNASSAGGLVAPLSTHRLLPTDAQHFAHSAVITAVPRASNFNQPETGHAGPASVTASAPLPSPYNHIQAVSAGFGSGELTLIKFFWGENRKSGNLIGNPVSPHQLVTDFAREYNKTLALVNAHVNCTNARRHVDDLDSPAQLQYT